MEIILKGFAMNRRSFVTAALSVPAAAYGASVEPAPGRAALRCSSDGKFRVLSISDLHYHPDPDQQGIALTEMLIETEKPGLVVVNGDCISGKQSHSVAELRRALENVATAMERKRVPWAVTFGNHDQEHFEATKVDKHAVLDIYASYPHNLNGGYAKELYGGGTKYILIWNSAGTKPVYCIWLIDSNDYFVDGKNHPYDWIRSDQVQWYIQNSVALETQYGAKIPGLMFFHIPLPEFNEMVNTVGIVGVRHENECPSPVNSGMFGALLDRGDVRGVYCGHDHVNNYVGRWRGIELGYDGVIGYNAYPRLAPDDPGHLHIRGGRAFEITDASPAYHRTWMRFRSGNKNWEAESEGILKSRLYPS
ncbi:MAG: metallophosphoesterase family protein [Bryobacterales bacterium]|nr:metallophosphoesterase family protein [Bryobacterales bacterium]